MQKIRILFLLQAILFLSGLCVAQPGGNNTCITAAPFCGSATYTFPSGGCTSNCFGQPDPCYGCMTVPNNPAWYYMQISTAGTIVLSISESPYADIDFCCWGPFPSVSDACAGGLTCSKIVSCSFSPSGNETCTIANAIAGQFYILVLSNFINVPTQITFLQSNWGQPGAGSTNCNLVTFCSLSAITATPTACSSATNTFTVSGTIQFSNAPTGGTLTITDITAAPPVSQVFTSPFISPKSYTLNGIPCDGTPHSLVAAFSDSINCTLQSVVQSPPAQCPTATISGGGIFCNTGAPTGTVLVSITGGVPPYSFTYAIDGVPQPPVTNYSGPFPFTITAVSSGTFTLVSVSGSTCSGTVSGTVTVTYVPLPAVGFAVPAPVCDRAPSFALTGGTPPGGAYSGTGVSAGIFNPAAAGNGTHLLTYTFTDLNGCTDSAHATILVSPTPVLTNDPLSDTLCTGQFVSITLTSNVPATSFSWVASPVSGNISGYTNGAGTTLSQTLFNNGVTPGVVKYTVSMNTALCIGQDTAYYIVVRPKPVFTTTPPDTTICGSSQTHIVLRSNVALTLFAWTASGSSGNVTGFGNGNGGIIVQDIQNTGYNIESVIYFITLSASGCTGDPANYSVTVNPLPTVTNNACPDSLTTTNAQPFPLRGGAPPGGTWSGPAVTAGNFYPSLAGTGSKAITYTCTNRFGCSRSVTRKIRVLAPTAFSCGNALTDIRDGRTYATVQIGSQCWMAANLDFGNLIPSATNLRDNCIPEKYCYSDLAVACGQQTYYPWDELMNYDDTPARQGLCPPGWHVPTETEWNTLFMNWTGSAFAGAPLLQTGFSGFGALLTGARHFLTQWDYSGFAAFFWTSSSHGSYKAWGHGMNNVPDDQSVSLYPSARSNAFPARCTKD